MAISLPPPSVRVAVVYHHAWFKDFELLTSEAYFGMWCYAYFTSDTKHHWQRSFFRVKHLKEQFLSACHSTFAWLSLFLICPLYKSICPLYNLTTLFYRVCVCSVPITLQQEGRPSVGFRSFQQWQSLQDLLLVSYLTNLRCLCSLHWALCL